MKSMIDNKRAGAKRTRRFCVGVALTLLLLTTFSGIADTLVVTPPKSVFVSEPGFGRDPFYPNSKRRTNEVVVTEVVVETGFPSKIVVNGISGRQGRPLAIINNVTFAVGETNSVKIDGEKISVWCIEIDGRSVRMRANGETRILKLQEREL